MSGPMCLLGAQPLLFIWLFLCAGLYEFLNVRCDIKLQRLGEVGGGRAILQEGETEA